MNFRQRLVAAALWTGVAALMAITLEPGLPTTVDAIARLFVVVTALALAAVYVYDPWDVISRYHA